MLEKITQASNLLAIRLTGILIALAVFFLPISKALVEVGVISAIILMLINKALKKEWFLVPWPILMSYIIFLAACLASIFPIVPAELKFGIRGMLKYLQYLGMFWLCAEWFQTKERNFIIVNVFLASMTLVSINGLFQLATGTDFLRHVSLDPGRITRMKSSLGAANALASFYCFAIPLTLIYFGKNKKINLIAAGLFTLFTACFILTFSRGAFLGIVISSVFILALNRKWKFLMALVLLIALALSACQPLYLNFVGSLNFKDITINERLDYWGYTWKMIQNHPYFGIGLNMFHQKLPLYMPAGETYLGYAHNSYLQMWAEIGFFGLLSFLFPLIWGIGRAITHPKPNLLLSCLLTGCIAFLTQAFFDNHFYALQTAFLFWIFWGMLIGLSSSAQNKTHPAS
jgi:putative inorganic carbon (hco3(-)) transporter